MIDSSKISILNDEFEYILKNAKARLDEGKKAQARKLYLQAALKLLDMAKLYKTSMKRSTIQRAADLVEIAESMKGAKIEAKGGNNGGGGGSNGGGDNGDGKMWTASPIPDISFADVAGLEDVKKAITVRMINPLKYRDKYQKYDKKSGGGVLLYGPPGTGKTMIAKAIAHEVGATFYSVKSSDIVSKWVGESEQNIKSLFETAKQDPLAVIFIDELESLFGARGQDSVNDRRVTEFLQHIDGFGGRAENLLLLGATNLPWNVDSAAMRSGRFSEKIYVPLPDVAAREYLVKRRLGKVPVADDVDIKVIAERLDGYSGADIEEVCDRAKIEPIEREIRTGEDQKLTMADVESALSRVRPSVSAREIKLYEEYSKG